MTEAMNFKEFKKDIMKYDDMWFPIWVGVDPNYDGSLIALVELLYPERWQEKNCIIDVIISSFDDGREIYDWAIRCHRARIKKIEAMKKELDDDGVTGEHEM